MEVVVVYRTRLVLLPHSNGSIGKEERSRWVFNMPLLGLAFTQLSNCLPPPHRVTLRILLGEHGSEHQSCRGWKRLHQRCPSLIMSLTMIDFHMKSIRVVIVTNQSLYGIF